MGFLLSLLPIILLTQVDTVWARIWSSPGALSDWAYAIAINDSGYIYVTGKTEHSGTGDDWTTIKYTPEGETVWVRDFASSGSYNERASSITIGPSGNIYITGYTMSSGAGDYLTIKYRPNGDTVWTRRYNGTGNGYDFAHWISVDGQENVYVTGYSRGFSYQDDIATIKYDSSGNQLWVSRLNGSGNYNDKGHKVIADNNGNVYVVGYVNPYSTGTFYDYVTIKLNAENGETLWVRTYNGPTDSSDIARDIAIDNSGNVYVTGSVRWTGTSTDIFTIKYDANGSLLWTARYNNPDTSGGDGGYGIKVDNEGCVYVVGQSQGLGTGSDIVLIKYDADGNEMWVRRYDGPTHNYDTPSDEVGGKCIAMDQAANIYIGGTSRGLTEYNDYVAVMYDSAGNQQWSAMYDFYDSLDYCLAIAVHPNSGDVVITGRTLSSTSYYDWGTVKFRNLIGINKEKGNSLSALIFEVLPNPFFDQVTIKIPKALYHERLSLNIYDISGRIIKVLNPEFKSCHRFSDVVWDGTDWTGREVAPGVYFVCFVVNGQSLVQNVIHIR
uniref:Pyrrolo-quinoline quinone repeat domain-containing protein n=1 Tax=candidate division WOR-3 bacterium TaxID=2052148 RepID=A0A7C4XJM2_UNCW3